MYRRVLIPLDGSPLAEQALPHAIAQAEQFGAELILLRILKPLPQIDGLSHGDLVQFKEQGSEWASKYLERIAEASLHKGIPTEMATVEGSPHAAILQFAESNQVDLIVICTRGRSGLSRWLMGSVADRIVRGANVPVLLVRAAKKTDGDG